MARREATADPPPPPLVKPAGEDALCRWAGFKISQRPAAGAAVWVRGKKMFDHRVAVRIAERQWAATEKRLAEGQG